VRLLVLGGTVFLGRHLIDAALASGHQVTLFTRGRHNPDLYPRVERLRGDRDGDLSALRGREWDAVIDTSGYVPRVVRDSAHLLSGAAGHYTFISSLSVYHETTPPGTDESAPVATLEDETVEEITGETYGPLKALCEREVERALPGRSLIIRPGLIVGPHDPSDRFTYWPHRVARGGETLAPGEPDGGVQFIDARDLADWTLGMAEQYRTGVYNADGPEYRLTMERLLETCKAVSGSDARFIWMDDPFLLDQGVEPWIEVPLWIPRPQAESFFSFDVSKAIAAGLTFRPLEETVRDTLVWASTRPADHAWKAGLAPDREQEILQAWSLRAGQ